MYADYDYYIMRYPSQNRLTKAEYELYAAKASAKMDVLTANGIDSEKAELDACKLCCCELAEYMAGVSSSRSGVPVSSESVGDYSVSYGSATERENGIKKRERDIVSEWLEQYGLVYRGVSRHVL